MCTIHQPSAVLLDLFDQILLLEQPGKTVYFGPLGPNSETMIRYFEGFGAQPHLVGENPADWVLKVTQVKVHGSEGWGTLWDQSPEKAALSKELDKLAARGIAEKNAPVDHDVASSLTQTWHVLQRMTQEHWRTPTYVWSMFILCFGTVFASPNLSQ
jgi:ATP-binding cassette subfamily G (WHITE) protein 2 (PDR)